MDVERGIAGRSSKRVALLVGVVTVALGASIVIADDGAGPRGWLGWLDGYELAEPRGQVFDVPSAGDAYPAWLSDGRPVFVAREPDGDVHVFEATDLHGDATEAVLWCPTSGWFEEPLHGTRFDSGGRWMGGPGPRGLLRFVVDVDEGAGTVEVGPSLRRLGRDEEAGERDEPLGPMCAQEDGSLAGEARFHVRPEGRLPAVEELVGLGRGWYVTDVHLDGQGRVCSPRNLVDGRCGQDAPVPRTVPLHGPDGLSFLAAVEVEGAALTRVIRLVEP